MMPLIDVPHVLLLIGVRRQCHLHHRNQQTTTQTMVCHGQVSAMSSSSYVRIRFSPVSTQAWTWTRHRVANCLLVTMMYDTTGEL